MRSTTLLTTPIVLFGLALSLSVSACSCDNGGGVTSTNAIPTVDQEHLDFGDVEVGGARIIELELSNTGQGTLKVENTLITGTGKDWFQVSPRKVTLATGGIARIEVTFQPIDVGVADATITFFSNSRDVPEKVVTVTGRGFIPAVAVTPQALDFGNVIVETLKTLSITVSNTGTDAAGVRLRPLTGQSAAQFEMTAPAGTSGEVFLLEAGNEATIDVTYSPALTGRHLAAFTIEPCDACQPVNVNLSGVGIESGLVVEPASIDFGAVNPGSTLTRPITFRNIGNRQVQITGVDPVSLTQGSAPDPAFSVESLTLPIVLDEGDVVPVGITFSPGDLNSHTGAIGWYSTDPKNPEGQVVVVGRGGGPDIELLPPSVEFGPVAMGAPLTRRVIITNVGFENLVISDIAIRGSTDFTIVSSPTDLVLPVGDVREVVVAFDPTTEASIEGELVVSSNDADELEAIAELHGTGIDLPPCSPLVTPPALNFGNVERNKRRTLEFGVTNPAGASDQCLVSVLDLTGDSDPEFSLPAGPLNGILLDPGQTQRVAVEFMAADNGSYHGTVRFYVSDPSNPEIDVALTATARAAEILIAPDDLDFGVIKVGCSTRDRQFCVYNTGSTNVTLMDLTLVESSPNTEFFFMSFPPGVGTPSGQTITPGGQACFTMSYKPVDLGDDSAAVYLDIAQFPDPFVITVTGTGATDAIQTDTFVQLDQPEADILFVIDNSCSMYEEQTALSTNFDSFIRFATQQAIDYHIAATTTDTGSSGEQGAFVPTDGSRARIVTPDLTDPEGVFRANVQLGTSGSATEKGLEAGYMALSDPKINDPTVNGGFLRPDAHLAVIFISDEHDQSGNVVDFYINFFLNIRGFRRANLFSGSAIVGPSPGGCSGAGGSASAGPEYIDVARRTGGVVESICTSDWSKALENLSLVAFGYKSRFFLNNIPVPGTVTVVVHRPDGSSYTATAWDLDTATNSVDFDPLAIPEPGDTVEVTYEVQCL
ncbi:MAG: choice-of-anchor D domain-containing protein [Deltaproteobacteria bacterium]|nr:choice-of-anchor D domain-containing protein [Deltaproteobacteria bacterium]